MQTLEVSHIISKLPYLALRGRNLLVGRRKEILTPCDVRLARRVLILEQPHLPRLLVADVVPPMGWTVVQHVVLPCALPIVPSEPQGPPKEGERSYLLVMGKYQICRCQVVILVDGSRVVDGKRIISNWSLQWSPYASSRRRQSASSFAVYLRAR